MVTFVAVIALVSGINVLNAHKSETLSDVALANVEALSDTESLMIGCDNFSVVVVCKRTCFGCYTEYKTINGYGNSIGFKGTCKCGWSY